MTLQELFNHINDNPTIVTTYFVAIPLVALLTNFMGKGEGNLSPWKFLYAALLFLVAIPGIFAAAFSVYLFLFERKSIFDTDIFIQVLPILSMVATIFIIKRNASFEYIPGTGRLSSLVTIISCTLIFMWIMERTHFYVFTNLPFQTALLIFVVLFVAIRYSFSRLLK
jgi:hypothetical protein